MNCGAELTDVRQKMPKKQTDSYILIGGVFLLAIIIILFVFNSNHNTYVKKINSAVRQNTAMQQSQKQPSMKMMQKIQQLKEAYQKNPNDFKISEKLGNNYFDINEFDQAIFYYKRALNIKANQPDLLIDLGVAYFNIKKPDSALFLIKKAVRINPDHTQGLFNLGIIYYNINKPQKAIDIWETLVSQHPESREAQMAKGYITQIKNELNKS